MGKVAMGFEKKEDLYELRELFKHHIESFDHFVDAGLENAIRIIRPIHVSDPISGKKLRIWLGKAEVKSPVRDEKGTSLQKPMFPQECRESNKTYRGKLTAEVCFQLDGGAVVRQSLNFGHLPIMLMSKLCHLRGADPKRLVSYKEEATGMGGYFICKGNERLCRSLILPKRNFPMATIRKSYSSKGDGFTDKAVSMRCVREDQSSVSVRLYYLQNGSARIGFWVRKKEFLLPIGIVLKALIDTTDRGVYVSLTSSFNVNKQKVKGAVGTQLVGERAQIILNELRDLSLLTRVECLRYIGQLFQPIMYGFDDESYSVVGEAVLREYVLVHLDSNHDKFNLLIFMLQKLFALVDQTAAPDNPDALQFQEVLLTGHLLAIYAKEKFEVWLGNSRKLILKELKNTKDFDIGDLFQVKKIMNKSSVGIGGFLESMIKTGKMTTVSGLDLPQTDGMTIEAERLNFLRFLSHFRSVHRGAAFAKMRTTTVRKLLPESWGFLCPVHTPDGTPCGLLNHMTAACRVTSYYDSEGNIKDFLKIRMSILTVLFEMGMIPLLPKLEHLALPEFLQVLLDGRVVGSISSDKVEKVVAYLRKMKSSPSFGILDDLEVGYVALSLAGAYPGLYLFTSPSRLVRPVRNISQACEGGSAIEYIGPFEQVYMEIRCADGGGGGRNNLFPATHEEIHPTSILSVVANLTPWSDHNQSPRNMYQCQMAKQTLAFGSQTLKYRSDNKLYHLQTPQSPIVRTTTYTKYCLDEFPTGTNAIVAVLAYTGYDMEDAMILNKSSVERGFCHGSIYQTESIDLENLHTGENVVEVFAKSVDRSRISSLDSDGLPFVGQIINPKGIMYSTFNTSTNRTRFAEMKGSEPSFIDYVAIDGSSSTGLVQKAKIRFRRTRNPIIGDKFSSRHGQKGVCSKLWPDIDMPFSCITGMRPDLIINPHAFPSRMTIAMLLESLGAKGGSLQGKFVDATPFSRCTRENVNSSCRSSTVDDLGPLLASYGFNYHGLEVMYSGVFGTELAFEVFIGPVYYQRLRHMVSDKYQVRSTGPIDQITRQPIGGRKRGGGIRFGEMERDALLAHGATYLLHDRLHTSSDYHIADVCSICGSLLTASTIQNRKRAVREISGLPPVKPSKTYTCHACNTSKGMKTVAMPYVFRYLAAELAAMNVNMSLSLKKRTKA